MAKTGFIKTIKEGFGFIASQGEDFYFKPAQVNDAGYTIEVGAPVEFEITQGRDGKSAAKNVRLTGFAEEQKSAPSAYSPPSKYVSSSGSPPATLPEVCIFKSFYGEDGFLEKRLFFEAAQEMAIIFDRADRPEVKASQFRQIYQQFLALAIPLRKNEKNFPQARESFGTLYAERVVRAVNRDILNKVVKDLFDRHKDLALSEAREMLGFFRYLTNILCYSKKKS
jgi:cold shock CspA family protein